MDPQVNKKSNVFAYVLLGLIVFIVLILIFDKKNHLYNPIANINNKENTSSRDSVMRALSKDQPVNKKLSSEEQAKVMAVITKDQPVNKKLSSEEQAKVMAAIGNK